MKFDQPWQVLSICTNMQTADAPGARNRAAINAVFNGNSPYTDAELQQGVMDTNVNFLKGANIIHGTRTKLYQAFFGDETLFTVSLPKAPAESKGTWESYITNEINALIKGSKLYFEQQRNKLAQLALHGVGPMIWEEDDKWKPRFFSLEDWKVPHRTLVDCSNLPYFACFRRYTPAELYQKAVAPGHMDGWNETEAKRLVEWAMKSPTQSVWTAADWTRPELWEEDVKTYTGFWNSDIVQTIDTWDFFYLDDDNKVQRKVIAVTPQGDSMMQGGSGPSSSSTKQSYQFLFESKAPVAENFQEVMALHVTDGANVAPFRMHAVRGLGYLLYAMSHLDNRMLSKTFDAMFEGLLTLFDNASAASDIPPTQVLSNYGVVQGGYRMIPASERHSINEPLTMNGIALNRQMMDQQAASFSQGLDSGRSDETATAVIAKINEANALLTGMLTMAFVYQLDEYKEICRRFCLKTSSDPEVKLFQDKMKECGVPKEWVDSSKWQIRINKPVGSGNKTLELLKITEAFKNRGAFDESAQKVISRKFLTSLLDDPATAAQLVPDAPEVYNNSIALATQSMGTLMQGLPVMVPESIEHGKYAMTLIQMATAVVKRIENDQESMATEEQVIGLNTVIEAVGQQIEIIAQDETKMDAARLLADQANQLANYIKGYSQRLAQQQEGDGGVDQAALLKMQMETGAKIQINDRAAVAKEERKNFAFQQEQQRKNLNTGAEIQRKNRLTLNEINRDNVTTLADITRNGSNSDQETVAGR